MSLSNGRRRLGVAGGLSLVLVLAPFLCLRNTAPPQGKVTAVAGTSSADLAIGRPFSTHASRSMLAPRSVNAAVLPAPPATVPPTTAPAPKPATTVRRVEAAAVVKPRAMATATTTPPPKPAPAPKPPPSSTTTAPPAPAHVQTGEASWYRGDDGECANNAAPMGAVVRVTNLDNGKSTTCRVTSRGPYGGGRVVDLTKTTFARIADPAVGVFRARVEW